MFSKILPITTVGLFIGLSTASYSAGSLLCHESLDKENASSPISLKKRQREELVHDPLRLEELAEEAQNMDMLLVTTEFLPVLEQDKGASEPETKKLDLKKTVSFERVKYLREFANHLVEDGEGWLQYFTFLTEESRNEDSVVALDAPIAKSTPFPKSILGEQHNADRQEIKNRRARFLEFVQTSTQNRRNVQLEQTHYLQQPEGTSLGYWMDQYSQAHSTAAANLDKFNEYLPLYDELVDAAKKIIENYENSPSQPTLQQEYANIMSQLQWYEEKLIFMAGAYGKAQRCILAAIDASRNPENPAGFEKSLRPIYVANVKNAIYCSFRLESFLNKEYFNSLSNTFLCNLQIFIIESLYLDDNQEKYAGLVKASGYLNKFSQLFTNNINSFHASTLPSVDHLHGDFGPCKECADVCVDCLDLIRNLEEKKELVSRLLREHAPQAAQQELQGALPTPMDIDKK